MLAKAKPQKKIPVEICFILPMNKMEKGVDRILVSFLIRS